MKWILREQGEGYRLDFHGYSLVSVFRDEQSMWCYRLPWAPIMGRFYSCREAEEAGIEALIQEIRNAEGRYEPELMG